MTATPRLRLMDESLTVLDGLAGIDTLTCFIGDERPLQGLAGLVDWRLCGALSRVVRDGHFEGAFGEALLIPSGGRLPLGRIFCFGTGPKPLSDEAFERLATQVCSALAKANTQAFACALPIPDGVDLTDSQAKAWLRAIAAIQGKTQILLGDTRMLQRVLGAAKKDLGTRIELEVPAIRVEMPGRPSPPLSVKGAVVR